MALKKTRVFVGIAACVIISSCASQADLTFAKLLSPQEKAEILFNKGIASYNEEILGNGNLDALDDARACFETALKFDPLHAKAPQYLDELRTYSEKKYTGYIAAATALMGKESRNDAQNRELLVAIRKATTIKASEPEVKKLAKDAATIRAAFLERKNAQLAELTAKITAEKSLQKMQKDLKTAMSTADEIFDVDPGNAIARKSTDKIESHVTGTVSGDIDLAKAKLAQKKYADAEAAILRAERSIALVSDEPAPDIKALKYQIYFSWGSALYEAKKYQSADDKASLALKANKTSEATALKAKIAKAAANRDYDADIDDILASIDSEITGEDPAGAMQLIQTNAGRLKAKANIAKLEDRKKAALALRDRIYKDGVALYNEEDYESARQKFIIVVAVDPSYAQAQTYLDKTNTKIKALSGAN